MPIASPRYVLTQVMVPGAPDAPGVYALWEDDELIYIGHARGEGATIRSCLERHLESASACTKRATHYSWEISTRPAFREAELLREFQRAHERLPRCNRSRRA